MVDLNGLKTVNDTYGHDHGDKYIIGACHLTCEVFKHSPVYRIGGDEFVVVLKDIDYLDRETLVEALRNRFNALEGDLSREPWERYSAAVGIAVYNPELDSSTDDVLHRADEAMYENKRACKSRAVANRNA
jgi:diguanylate cyclase (GGDEF)-like protein